MICSQTRHPVVTSAADENIEPGTITTQKPSSLSPDQKSLQAVALRQLQDVLTTLVRLQDITIEQANMEAVLDARVLFWRCRW